MGAITSEIAAQSFIKLLSARALPALRGELVIGNLVNRDFDSVLAQEGQTVTVNIPPAMSANNLAEGGTVTTQNPAPGNAEVTLNKHIEASFSIPDVVAALTRAANGDFGLIDTYMQPAIVALAEQVETDLFALAPYLTANTAVGAGNTAILETVFDDAETALFKAKVPRIQRKVGILGATPYSTARQLPRLSEMQTAGNGYDAIINGQFLRAKGIDWFRSDFVYLSGTTRYNMAFARDAIALVTRLLGAPIPGTGAIAEYVKDAESGLGFRVVMSYNAGTLTQQFTVDLLYGVNILRNGFGVQVLSN